MRTMSTTLPLDIFASLKLRVVFVEDPGFDALRIDGYPFVLINSQLSPAGLACVAGQALAAAVTTAVSRLVA